MIEIDLHLNGKPAFEYTTNSVPRVGEYLSISHEDVMGEFLVNKVTHNIYQKKRDKEVISYVTIEADRVTE